MQVKVLSIIHQHSYLLLTLLFHLDQILFDLSQPLLQFNQAIHKEAFP